MSLKKSSHNRPKSPEEFEIAPGYTIGRYIELKRRRDAQKTADLILQRFNHRFFKPLGYDVSESRWHDYRDGVGNKVIPSGWMMTSIACLAIESLINFEKGTKQINSAGKEFTAFFERNGEFAELLKAFPAFPFVKNGKNGEGNFFYSHVRCGLLHQGEIYGGWRLMLGKKAGEMVDASPGMRCIYARPILSGVGLAINRYCEGLSTDGVFTTSGVSPWSKALSKLDEISKNCGINQNALGNPIRLRPARNPATVRRAAEGRIGPTPSEIAKK